MKNKLKILVLLSFIVLMTTSITLAQNHGIETTAPKATLHVGGEDGLLVTGTLGSGKDLEVSGPGTRLFFYPKKSAFRVGTVAVSEWDNINIGNGSTAWGSNTIASGELSTAWGEQSTASGNESTAWGVLTSASGLDSTAWGFLTTASGEDSTAWGLNTTASGLDSTAWGFLTTASGDQSTAWGDTTTASGDQSTTWGVSTLASGENSTAWGLETTASSSWSTAWGKSTTASAFYSTVWGLNTTASGGRSTAWGHNTTASGLISTAWGADTSASGEYSTAWGTGTTASDLYSSAWGQGTTASSQNSTAWGWSTKASGVNSTAWGYETEAKSGYETAFGFFNTDYTPASTTNVNFSDKLLVVGNGTSSSDRKDAMVILKNGNTGIGRSNPQNKLEVAVTTNITPNGDGIALYNTQSSTLTNPKFWNIHMSSNFLRFSFNNSNVSYIDSSTGAYQTTSDKRLKENIQALNNSVLDRLLNINTVKYNYKRDKSKTITTGLIAQELKELFPEFVSRDEGSKYYGVNYAGLSVVAIKGIQEQQDIIERQQNIIESQQDITEKQQDEINNLKAKNKELENKIDEILDLVRNK